MSTTFYKTNPSGVRQNKMSLVKLRKDIYIYTYGKARDGGDTPPPTRLKLLKSTYYIA